MKLLCLPLLPLLIAASPQTPQPDAVAEPYRILREATQTRNPALAARAYAVDAILVFDHSSQPRQEHRGRAAIEQSYVRTFRSVDPSISLDIDFRFDPPGLSGRKQSGVYRIVAQVGTRPVMTYGRFSVTLREEGGAWRFAQDWGRDATAADYERLSWSAADSLP